MNKLFFLIFCFVLFSVKTNAQNYSVSGKITDKTNQPLIGAGITVLNMKDSSLMKGTVADVNGNFEIAGLQAGKLIIKFSFIGYRDLFLNKEIVNAPLLLGNVTLNEKAEDIGVVNVVGKLPPAQLKGDTTQYNAGAFKTNPDANAEDLVTKMPGITSQDGKVQAQGEDVKQVLVDGKPFFGDDPNAVLKNIPAELIDKIEVFDKKSDQAQFTGFDDGNTSKTLNIITKPQFRNGVFGRIYGGYGNDENFEDDKYRNGFAVNFFKDKRRFTILANSNNVNEQNFSTEDLLGVIGTSGNSRGGRGPGGGGGGFGGRGGGRQQGGQQNDADNFLVNQKGGINTTQSFGVNYADKWKNLEFTGSYFFNYTENNSVNDLRRQYIAQSNEGIVYTEQGINASKNFNHRINLKFDWKMDSLNSILFQPKISVQNNDGSSIVFGENRLRSAVLNNTNNTYSSNLDGITVSAPLLYRHSFAKKGRTISLNITPGYNGNKGNSNLFSYVNYFSDSLANDSLNQLADLDKKGWQLSSNINYTEPLNDKTQLQFTYGTNLNKSESDKQTFNYSAADDSYNAFDTSLSNKFESRYMAQFAGASYRYQQEKWNISVGANYQFAELKNNQEFPSTANTEKKFNSILPNARFQYNFTKSKNLRANYRSNNNVPSVDQLQQVINNSNPLQLSAGNPDLKQDWQNNVNIRYSSVNAEKSTSLFVLLGSTYTMDYVANSTFIADRDTLLAPGIILGGGSQLTRPVNVDGYYSVRSFVVYGFPVDPLKLKLNLNVNASYSRTPALINSELNYAGNSTTGAGITFASNISEKVDFTISSNSNFSKIANTLQTASNSDYFNQNSKLRVQVMPWKGLVLQTDLNHYYYSGLSATYNQNYLLWNAAIGYKFLKNRVAEIRLSAYDLLKQNNSITRNTTETYYEDVQTNVLQRYFMLTFTYNLKFFKETKKAE